MEGPKSDPPDTWGVASEAGQNGLLPQASLLHLPHLLIPHPQSRVVHPLKSIDPEEAKCWGLSIGMNHQSSYG